MLWSYFTGLNMFEFIKQYHVFLSGQPFPTSHTNCKTGLERLLCASVFNLTMGHSYSCILSLDIKNPSPVRTVHLHSGDQA